MATPRWLDWNLYSGSACEDFIYQLQGHGVSSGIWKGIHLGDHLVPDWARKDSLALNDDGSCVVKDLYVWFTDLVEEWAKKFLLFYDGDKLLFDITNEDASQRIDLSVDIDWQAFCHLWNCGGICFGIGNFDDSPLPDKMFSGDCSLSWDGKKITVKFEDEDRGGIVYTPQDFVARAVNATANRFKKEFGRWIWLFRKPDGWMKTVDSWEEFESLLKKPHTTEYQLNQLQRSYDSSHGDFYQTEVKIAFEDGSALYGVAGGADENKPFVKGELGFTGDLEDDDCKFSLPIPILNCWLWY